jgi:hypothetical protein
MPEEKKFISKSSVMSSPYFAVIMDSYEKFGRSMSMQSFWTQYVVPVDPKIIYMTWMRFVKKISQQVEKKQDLILNNIIEKKATENEMEKSSLQNILAISQCTLDQLVENPNLLTQIPVKERMKWLFSAMKARDSRMVALTKVNAEKRKTTMFDDMLQAAQYGAIKHEEFTVPPEVDTHQAPPISEITKKVSDKIVEFDPEEL